MSLMNVYTQPAERNMYCVLADNYNSLAESKLAHASAYTGCLVQGGMLSGFNGAANSIVYYNSGQFNRMANSGASLEMRVYIPDVTTNQYLITMASSNGYFRLQVNGGQIYGGMHTSSTSAAAGAIAIGWHHIVMRSTGINVSIILDGVNLAIGGMSQYTTIGDVWIGSNQGLAQFCVAGTLIDYVRFYATDIGILGAQKLYYRSVYTDDSGLCLDLPMLQQHHDVTNLLTKDVSRYGTNCVFAAATGAPSKLSYRRGYNFDGGNDRMTVADADNLDITGDITIVAYFTMPTVGEYSIVDKGSAGTGTAAPYLIWVTGGSIYGGLSNGTAAQARTCVARTGTQHIVLCSDSGGTIYLYENGELRSSTARTVGALSVTNNGLTVGSMSTGIVFPFKGQMHWVQLYNKCFTPMQVKDNYSMMKRKFNEL